MKNLKISRRCLGASQVACALFEVTGGVPTVRVSFEFREWFETCSETDDRKSSNDAHTIRGM